MSPGDGPWRGSPPSRWAGALLIITGLAAGFAGNALSHWSCRLEWGDDCEMAPGELTLLAYLFAAPFVMAGLWLLLRRTKR